MSNTLTYIAIAIAVASAGGSAYLYNQFQKLGTVTNTQGQVIMLMLETPEIKAVMEKELQRRQTPQNKVENSTE